MMPSIRSHALAFLSFIFFCGLAKASAPGSLSCFQMFVSAPNTVKDLLVNLQGLKNNKNNYVTERFGQFFVAELSNPKVGENFRYRIAYSVESQPNSLGVKVTRRVDFADSSWAAKDMFLKPYREKAKPEFDAIPAEKILESAKRIAAQYVGKEGQFGKDAQFTEDMMKQARRGFLDEIATRLMKVDAAAEFAAQKINVDLNRDPMLLNRWIDYKLEKIIEEAERLADLKFPMQALKDAVDVQGGVDLFGAPVEQFALSPRYAGTGNAHGPYTNIFANREIEIRLSEYPDIRARILEEIQRFIVLNQF